MLWYSLEAPCQGTSNEYPQHKFLRRNKKNNMWIPPFICSYVIIIIFFFNFYDLSCFGVCKIKKRVKIVYVKTVFHVFFVYFE